MKIDDIKLFMLVVELQSFSSAAEALNLPRSTVSRRISELEAKLSAKLLIRTTRNLTLTTTGLDYYNNMLNIIPQFDKANEVVRTQSHSPTGRIKIGFINESDILCHDILQGFLRQYPNIQIETHLSSLGYHDIISYGLDASIHIGPIADSSFVARQIKPFKRKLYAGRQYMEKFGKPESLNELKDHSIILLRWPDGRLENTLQFQTESVVVNSQLIVNNSYFIRHSVLAGSGIALMPEIVVKEALATGEVVDILPEHETMIENIWLVYPSRQGTSHAARLFIDYFLDEINKWQ